MYVQSHNYKNAIHTIKRIGRTSYYVPPSAIGPLVAIALTDTVVSIAQQKDI